MSEGADEGPYDGYYSPQELRSLRAAAQQSGVDAEIGAARVALIRLLASDAAEERPELVVRAVEAIVRAIRVRHQITGGAASNLVEGFDRLLAEMGYGEGS